MDNLFFNCFYSTFCFLSSSSAIIGGVIELYGRWTNYLMCGVNLIIPSIWWLLILAELRLSQVSYPNPDSNSLYGEKNRKKTAPMNWGCCGRFLDCFVPAHVLAISFQNDYWRNNFMRRSLYPSDVSIMLLNFSA